MVMGMSTQPLGNIELSLEDAIREANTLRDTVARNVAAGMDSSLMQQAAARLEHLAQLYPGNGAIADAIKQVTEAAQVAQTQQAASLMDRSKNASGAEYAINPQTEKLAASLDRLGLWTEEERKKLEAIIPNKKYQVPIYKNGHFTGEFENLEGQEIRNSETLLKSATVEESLSKDPQAQEEYNTALGINPNGVQTSSDRKKKTEALKDAAIKVAQYKAAQNNNDPAELQKIERQLEKVQSSLDTINALQDKKEALPPSMQSAADALIKGEEKQRDAIISDLLDDNASPKQTKQIEKNNLTLDVSKENYGQMSPLAFRGGRGSGGASHGI